MKVLLYFVFGAIGFFLVWTKLDRGSSKEESPEVTEFRSISDRSGARVRQISRSLRTYSNDKYREAWDELPRKGLTKVQRVAAQTHLLRAWAEDDLESALAAALEEPWHAGSFATTDDAGSLISLALGELFVSQTDDFVEIMNNRSLGTLESVVLGKAFVESLGRHHPEVLESIVSEIQDPKVLEMSERSLKKKDR